MMPLVEIIAAGAASAQDLSAVLPQLNGSGSVVLEIDNSTGVTLTRVRDEQKRGGFAVTPELAIPPFHADVFGAENKGGSVGTGTEGSVVYNIGNLGELTISWDNHFFGEKSASAAVSGGNLALFRVRTTIGVGNTDAHMQYELFDRTQVAIPPPRARDVSWIGPDGGVSTTWVNPVSDHEIPPV
jgi:hypothetical protein